MNPFSRPRWWSYLSPPPCGLFEMECDRSFRKRIAKNRHRAKRAKQHKQQMRREGKL